MVSCIAPPGHSAALRSCVSSQVPNFHYRTKAERAVDYQAIATCLAENR